MKKDGKNLGGDRGYTGHTTTSTFTLYSVQCTVYLPAYTNKDKSNIKLKSNNHPQTTIII